MLTFVVGSSASGKTQYVRQSIEKQASGGRKNMLLLVPEQFSFETEREMLSALGPGFMGYVNVLSFTRMCDEVGRLYGGISGTRIGQAERSILMSRAINRLSAQLHVFKRFSGSAAFVQQVISVVTELKMAAVSSEALLAASGRLNSKMLSDKLEEIALIYATYEEMLKGTFTDPLDDMAFLFNQTQAHGYFKGKTVYIDAFKGFTGAQMKLLERMIIDADAVVLSLCSDSLIDSTAGVGTFSNIQATIARLSAYATDNGVEIGKPVLLKESHCRHAELSYLEQLLSNNTNAPFDQPAPHVTLGEFDMPMDELNYVFKTIHQLVRTEGYMYRDFVVIARDISRYESRIESIARRYDTPCFLDKRRSLSHAPLARLLLAAMQAAVSLKSDAIFAYLKTGLTTFSELDIAMLEEYVFIWEIDGPAWLQAWDMQVNGLEQSPENEEAVQNNAHQLALLNSLRQRVVQPILQLKQSFNGDCTEISKALYTFLMDCKVDEAIRQVCEEYRKNGNVGDADFIADSWDAVMSVLNSMVRCFMDETVTPRRYMEMLSLSFEGVTLGAVPPTLDEVSCGSADRIRPARPKVVFVIGLTQGEFPARAEEGGLLLKADRVRLERAGLPLSDQYRRFTVDENYLAYTSLCCALDAVYACCHRRQHDATSCEPSSIMLKLRSHFKNCAVAAVDDMPETTEEGFSTFAGGYRADTPLVNTLRTVFADIPQYKWRVDALKQIQYSSDRHLSDETLNRLYKKDLFLSASRIENYNKCAFSYFCKYVLKVKAPQKVELNPLQRGTIVHFVLEQVLRELGGGIAQADETVIREKIQFYMQGYLQSVNGFAYLQKPRFQFLYQEIENMLAYILLHISAEFQNSDFVPVGFEVDIADNGTVPALRVSFAPDRQVVLTGQIDRVDVLRDTQQGQYIRIVDYKTGSKSFYLPDVLYGLNLQMLIYLYAIYKQGSFDNRPCDPAGILYMPSNRGLTGFDGKDTLKMNGMLLSDDRVLDAMDKQKIGCYVPAKPSKERQENPMISAEDFETVFSYIDYIVGETARSISNGVFDIKPVDGCDSTACKYCDFAAVCQREQDKPSATVEKISVSTALEKMREVKQHEAD